MTESLITSEIDFDAPGKQTGFLRLPHSVHRSAYGWIPILVVMIGNGKGPTILLMAGNHGDEYEGQIAPYDGIVSCKRAVAQVARGDTLYQIAEDL